MIVEGGLDAALDKRTGNRIYAKKTDGDFEAHLIFKRNTPQLAAAGIKRSKA